MLNKYNTKIKDLITVNKGLSRIKRNVFNYCIF